jgi:DNA-binding MltR family transcriptional regulator
MARDTQGHNLLRTSFSGFMQEFVGESDRAAVILGAAKIEFLLEQILDKYLIPSPSSQDELLDGDSPLGTFSAKIKICHRLGIIDDRFCKLLNVFRRLRNGFAHDVTHSTLTVGSARDRVIALADPFGDSDFFHALTTQVANDAERSDDDPGVIFRAVLALFYIELGRIHEAVHPAERMFDDGIVEMVEAAKPPEESAEPKSDTVRE